MTAGIFDEYGQPWKVKGGDPAARLISRLGRANYRLVVLPLQTLATGEIREPLANPDDPIHRVRLVDCLAVLNRK